MSEPVDHLLAKGNENVVNRLKRHCRIGKVRTKFQPYPPHIPSSPPVLAIWPFKAPEQPPMFMDKCGCRVGSACGNVACPYRLVATC